MATGAIPIHADQIDLGNIMLVPVTASIASIAAGSPQSPTSFTITKNNVKPSGTSYFGLLGARIDEYPMPYTSSGAGGINATYVERVTMSGNNVTFTLCNLAGAWSKSGGYTFYAVLAFKKT